MKRIFVAVVVAALASSLSLARDPTPLPPVLEASPPLAPFVMKLEGNAEVLMGPEFRDKIGLKSGPDSILDLWIDPDGAHYILFSGASKETGRGTFRIAVDAGISKVSASASLTPLLKPFESDDLSGSLNVAGQSNVARFDYNYAGGGTTFRCPNGKILYAYHGENQMTPDAGRVFGSESGWAGIGLAVWNGASARFRRDQQIIGLRSSNTWRDTAEGKRTGQRASGAGNPSLIYQPTSDDLYVFYTDRSDDPRLAGPPNNCDRSCTAVAKAKATTVCADAGAGKQTTWRKYYNGSFSEPGVFRQSGEMGTGGKFSPLYSNEKNFVETVANVTYVPSKKLWVLLAVRQPGGTIIQRQSEDILHWTRAQELLVPDAPNVRFMYPRLLVTQGAGQERLVLVWLKRTEGDWKQAAEMRQNVSLSSQ